MHFSYIQLPLLRNHVKFLLNNDDLNTMAKKKKKAKAKKSLTKRLTKQLKKVIKAHGTELALGFVTGIITELIADKTSKPKKSKKNKNSEEEEPALATAVKETTRAVTNKVKAAIAPKTLVARKAPIRKTETKPVATNEPA